MHFTGNDDLSVTKMKFWIVDAFEYLLFSQNFIAVHHAL